MPEIDTPRAPAVEFETSVRVSTVELFFDLVFVFTITQLTAVLAARTTLVGFGQVLLILGVTWWMYGGYAWLTNAVAPVDTVRRGLLVTGMAGFLVMAISVPDAFASDGWAFGVGYFVVNAVHTGLFRISGGPGAARAIRGIGSMNIISASLVLGGGFAPVAWRYGLWSAALAWQIASPYMVSIGGFGINAAHFVERHGLVIIVAIGESVVAIGAGAAGEHIDAGLISVAVAGLIIAYFLYWTYFGGDEERAEHALAGIADPLRRARAALQAYGYAHYPMLVGVVAVAAGVKKAIGHATGHVSLAQALALGGGVALFLAGDLWLRATLRLGRPWYRLAVLFGALASVPLGVLSAAAQLATLMVVLVMPLSVEGLLRIRAARSGGVEGPPGTVASSG
ncbi:MAG TPA: low temperature requirement protein A [Micromonosporaceae bacterium]|nr:low temperature requirement protein A [Micromonosporaceae bacterium]